jgi:hypothetical protein
VSVRRRNKAPSCSPGRHGSLSIPCTGCGHGGHGRLRVAPSHTRVRPAAALLSSRPAGHSMSSTVHDGDEHMQKQHYYHGGVGFVLSSKMPLPSWRLGELSASAWCDARRPCMVHVWCVSSYRRAHGGRPGRSLPRERLGQRTSACCFLL